MIKKILASVLLLIVVAQSAYSETANIAQGDNAEMAKMFAEDQAIRGEIYQRGGWAKVKDDKAFLERWQSEDAARLSRTAKMLQTGAIKSGIDYYRAAFIFQHGQNADEYLKAHHLAVISLSLGYKDAKWISAATLDRYLQSIGKPQIYGTQFQGPDRQPAQPFDANLVSDFERRALDVPPLAIRNPQP